MMMMRMFQARIWAAVAITAYLVTGCKAQDETSSTVRIAAILDTVNLPWAQEVWDLTTQVVQTNDWLKTVVPEFATTNVARVSPRSPSRCRCNPLGSGSLQRRR